ncbi:alanyl-tRNA editing protein [Marispirochaeta sp.]|uniref:alanyl-tRNA editing protein n=1 Tax=Marispirochaeta sp. TaxID=2038653 RepID=UPI0029C7409E|nr:alanyl-tRNA editing protein [Marispirochaeta sp.]
MSVEKVFWNNPYLTQIDASVQSSDGEVITLDKTIFYAFSGGQESDSGFIGGLTVIRAEKRDKEIFYTIDSGNSLKPGQSVSVSIDWPRRYRLMRLHFAAELVLELVFRNYDSPEKTGAHISENKARLDFMWEGNISGIFPVLQEKLARIIEGNLEIHSRFSDPENETRYWEIEGFGKAACGGTHLRRTGEIGEIRLKRNNIGRGRERIEITLADPHLNPYGGTPGITSPPLS